MEKTSGPEWLEIRDEKETGRMEGNKLDGLSVASPINSRSEK